LATPNLRFPPDFPQLLSVGAIAFVGHVALATLPSCALSAGKIPTPKPRTYYCDVPNELSEKLYVWNFVCKATVCTRMTNSAI